MLTTTPTPGETNTPVILQNGLCGYRLKNAEGFEAEISLFGAQVLSWRSPKGTEYLFCSELADYSGKKPIRGGIPICWPQFGRVAVSGEAQLPSHGFARVEQWRAMVGSTAASLCLTLAADKKNLNGRSLSLQSWNHGFEVLMQISLQGNRLVQEISIQNLGDYELGTNGAFKHTLAFHNYFAAKVHAAAVSGCQGKTIINELSGGQQTVAQEAKLKISGPIDCAVKDAPPCVTLEVGGKAWIDIVSHTLPDLVIWNPWEQPASARPSDLGDNTWKSFLCVERAALTPIALSPLESKAFSQQLVALEE